MLHELAPRVIACFPRRIRSRPPTARCFGADLRGASPYAPTPRPDDGSLPGAAASFFHLQLFHESEGVFYASQAPPTALAEMIFHRLLFFAESPTTPWPSNPAEYTAFSARYAIRKSIDLTRGKHAAQRARWMHLTDCGHCQAFADAARAAGIEVIVSDDCL